MTLPRPGWPAPNFSLYDQDGRVVTLSDKRDHWVVLFFYPRDGAPSSTEEAREFTALKDEFDARDCIIYGISKDSPKRHRTFKDKELLSVELLSDPSRIVISQYCEKRLFRFMRSTVLIDPDGNVAHYWRHVQVRGHAARVLDKLKELQGDAAPPPA